MKFPLPKKRILPVLLLVVLILGIPKLIPLAGKLVAHFSPTPPPEPFQVDVLVTNADRLMNKIIATGDILAVQQVNLNAEVSGKVTELNIQEGAEVKKGQLLVKINDSDLQARLSRAEFYLELAKGKAKRQQQLFETGGISQEEYDASLGDLQNQESEVAFIKAEIDKTEIRAPFDGTLGLRYIIEGSYITPTTRIATLQNLNHVFIDFAIPEKYVSQVSPGDSIFFTVQNVDTTFSGSVYAIEPQVNMNTRTVNIRALSQNPGAMLRPGSLANVDLVLETVDPAITVPPTVLIPFEEGFKVYVLRNNKVFEQKVAAGIRLQDKVQIVHGIEMGDTLLYNGLLHVLPGDSVGIRTIHGMS